MSFDIVEFISYINTKPQDFNHYIQTETVEFINYIRQTEEITDYINRIEEFEVLI